MVAYVLKRLLHGLSALILLTAVLFLLTRATGDPLNVLLPLDASVEMRESLERQLGLDKSLPEQFVRYLASLSRGDLGESISYNRPVIDLFIDRYPNTLGIVIPAWILGALVGVPLGVVAATARRRSTRTVIGSFGAIGMAAPPFWVAIMFILFFSVQLGVLPSSRMGGLEHYILPVTSLGLLMGAGLLRLVRSSMLDALGTEYVKFARSEGLTERSVVWTHALRNSLNAGIAYMGVYFAILTGGSTVIEKVFAWPGVGQLLYTGIVSRDYPLVQGIILILAVFILLIEMAVDIVQAAIDPRVRLR